MINKIFKIFGLHIELFIISNKLRLDVLEIYKDTPNRIIPAVKYIHDNKNVTLPQAKDTVDKILNRDVPLNSPYLKCK